MQSSRRDPLDPQYPRLLLIKDLKKSSNQRDPQKIQGL